ncbi:hypothetical protein [Streptomyces roseolus]|uniref:hypothetical protein n=1 Tax=Streptomyces roseolus TaxID=67358 RepID=UPI0037A4A88C
MSGRTEDFSAQSPDLGTEISRAVVWVTVAARNISVADVPRHAAPSELQRRAPQNINELVEEVEAAVSGRFNVGLTFDRYPSRLQPAIVESIAAAVRAQASELGAGSPAAAQAIRVDDPKNASPVLFPLRRSRRTCPPFSGASGRRRIRKVPQATGARDSEEVLLLV